MTQKDTPTRSLAFRLAEPAAAAAIAEAGVKRLRASRATTLATDDFRDVIMGRGTIWKKYKDKWIRQMGNRYFLPFCGRVNKLLIYLSPPAKSGFNPIPSG
jgi:hypothetical protein